MSIWDKVSQGIDRAARVTENAIDEGKLRIAAFRARQRADRAAAALGYAVARARARGEEEAAATFTALVDSVVTADSAATDLETRAKQQGEA
jgi:hypothetical protein